MLSTLGAPLQYLIAIALLVAILSRGQDVVVPLALAMFIAFALSPAVGTLERRRVPRLVAVGLVLVALLTLAGGFTYLLTTQLRELAGDMPRYSSSIEAKIATLRDAPRGVMADVEKTVERVTRELERHERAEADAPALGSAAGPNPQPVLIVPANGSVERLGAIGTPVAERLLKAGVVIVLVAFMLMQREDLRNRLIRLVGQGRLTLTTRTLDEAGRRISRYLLTQSVINGGFGVVVALGLALIGIPYALLWGVVAALLRFVPYVGVPIAMVMPAIIAAVQFDGWGPLAATVGLFLVVDVVTANVVEPLIVGLHTGVSSLALLVSALFWSWLWGPIGLLLSTPITVCLAVLGKHVSHLGFLAVLLGDEPVLEPEVSVYQRLLADDEDEASEIVAAALRTSSRDEVFDRVLVPAVLRSARDRALDEISEGDHAFVLRAVARIVDSLGDADAPAGGGTDASVPTLVMVPARNAADALVLDMLSQLLDAQRWRLQRLSIDVLVSELLAQVGAANPAAVCIAAVPPGGFAHARYLVKRLRTRFPTLHVVVLRPDTAPGGDPIDGAEQVATLGEARRAVEPTAQTSSAAEARVAV
jgi:predicted PurR-regulated permease PerM